MKRIVLLLSAALMFGLCGAEYKISNIKLTLAGKAHQEAFDELKKHLELTGNNLAPADGALEIIVGKAGVAGKLAPEESRWLYKNGKLYIWGEDKQGRHGTLFAVYGLLEEKLGVRWIFPGDDGIHVPAQEKISFKENESYKRVPPFMWSYVRAYRWGIRGIDKTNSAAPPALRISKEKWLANGEQNRLFALRHRNSRTIAINYAHAFIRWPKRFAKTHMDYFGVSPYGKPMIPANPRYAKLCLTNPAVEDQIIADYKKARDKKYLNISPNDGTPGFCHCKNCIALDTRKKGEGFYDHLTDRYLNFWNRIIKRAKEINPKVMVATYVYSYYRHPPRREKIEHPDNMLCGLVPQLGEDSRSLFEAWKAVGMKHCFLRPNDLCYHSAVLRFTEKRMFNKFQETQKHFKLWGNDYDAAMGTSSIDMETYIACRMLSFPEKSFDELAKEYYSSFGAAGETVQKVYETLRPMGEAIYLANYKRRRGLMLDDSELENTADDKYIAAQEKQLAILNAFPENKLTPAEAKRFNRFKLVVEHSILAGKFAEQGKLFLEGKKNNFDSAAKALLDFRCGKGLVLNEKWGNFFRRAENQFWSKYQPYRDATGNDKVKLVDLAAGWRNSFDAPSMQEWRPRKGFKELTTKEASFDRYSIEAKPAAKAEAVMYRTGIAVTPGAKYSVSFDVKAPSKATFRLRVVAGRKTLKNITANANSTRWSQAAGTFTVPKDTEKLTMYIYIADAPQGGFIDNVVLTRQ